MLTLVKRLLTMTTLSLAAACGAADTNGGKCLRTGIVPADLRDTERAGEGLVTTTFGAYPDRTPSWTRAQSVNDILKTVWGRQKLACPGFPSAPVQAVDAAIVALDQSIAAKDQAKAVQASNAVGLAMPDLFDYFHPDAQKEIVRMDAVFRQVGIDAHFGDLTASAADLASMKTDWANLRSAVGARTPTCHRVGGTATVVSDIDQSLANLMTAIPAKDGKTIETESDNGALEIDTLELLFDCPADNAAPSRGLGARCATSATCDAGQTCDLNNAGGKCAPDASNKIGTPCQSTMDCGTDARAACNTEAGDAFPGGYCFMEPCDDVQVCPPGGTCVALGGEVPGCFKACTNDSDCRAAEGYVCQLFSTAPPQGFGPNDHACAFKCTRDSDCQMPLTCDVTSGKCKP